MTDSKPNPETSKEDPKGPSAEELQTQIENLNKGIATYRNEAKEAVRRAEAAEAVAKEAAEAAEAKNSPGDDLAALSPEDQKRLEAWAKSKGFATKEEMHEERQRIQGENLRNVEAQAVDEFLAQHPEYNDDGKWDELKREFGQYKQPASVAEYRKILNKVYKELNPKDDGAAKARAEIETRKRLSLGGGSQHSDNDEMTAEKLAERYPRLSKDQIEARLKEIKSIYPDKK